MPKRTNAAVTLTLEEAKAIYHLYATCIASEKHFRNCRARPTGVLSTGWRRR